MEKKQHKPASPYSYGLERFQNNLRLLKHMDKYLLNKIENLDPQRYAYRTDENGNPNIFDQESNCYLYKDAKEYCQQQINRFHQFPDIIRFSVGDKEPFPTSYLHDFHLERFRLEFHKNIIPDQVQSTQFLPTLLFMGCGIGLQIEKLLQNSSTFHLIIFEPDIEIFYAALHVIDLSTLLKAAEATSALISLYIGVSGQTFCDEFILTTKKQNSFLGVKLFILPHQDNSELRSAYASLQQRYHQSFTAQGFWEDEIVGLNHLLLNLIPQSNIIKNESRTLLNRLPPLIILGSGPSIDKNIQCIKSILPNALLMSCSSSIDTCFKNDITPDFHVEIERNAVVPDRLEFYRKSNFLDSTHFIGASCIHPRVQQFFASRSYGLKAKDLAASLIDAALPGEFEQIYSAGPTSGNGALAFAARMGFRQIYLVGLDMGFAAEQHHSHQTIYSDPSSPWYRPSMRAEMQARGYKGENVPTTFTLDNSRRFAEIVISNYSDLHVYHVDGLVKIEGAKFLASNDLHTSLNIPIKNRKPYCQNIINHCTLRLGTNAHILKDAITQSWMRTFMLAEQTIQDYLDIAFRWYQLSEGEKTFNNLVLLLKAQNLVIQRVSHSQPLHVLLGGSLRQIQETTFALSMYVNSEKELGPLVDKFIGFASEYFQDALQACRAHFLQSSESFDPSRWIEKYAAQGDQQAEFELNRSRSNR